MKIQEIAITVLMLLALGYIYNQYPSGTPNENWPSGQNINYLVGAPYHFYFGLKRGNSAMNKFITKYII